MKEIAVNASKKCIPLKTQMILAKWYGELQNFYKPLTFKGILYKDGNTKTQQDQADSIT